MTVPFFYSGATTFKSSAGVCISYTPTLQCIWIICALALGHYAPAGLVRIHIFNTHLSKLQRVTPPTVQGGFAPMAEGKTPPVQVAGSDHHHVCKSSTCTG